MELGFIGTGNMATAIARGVITANYLPADQVAFTDLDFSRAQALANELGACAVSSNEELVSGCEIVVLAVKPQHQQAVLKQVASAVQTHNPLIVSIAAGRQLADIEADLAGGRVVRVMPNVNATISCSTSAICAGTNASEADAAQVTQIFDTVGTTDQIAEPLFGVFAALAACSPAWVYHMIDTLARAGVAQGMPKDQALRAVAAAFAGSGQMVLDSAAQGVHPGELIDRVCSPAGTTVAGLLAAQDKGLNAALNASVRAAVARDRELGS